MQSTCVYFVPGMQGKLTEFYKLKCIVVYLIKKKHVEDEASSFQIWADLIFCNINIINKESVK